MPGIGDIDVAHAIGLPPARALDYYRSKGFVLPSWRWAEVWQQQHAVAFTVAKATQIDLLEDIRGAVDRFIAEGQTYREAARELEPVLREHGWWGRQEVRNPFTGELESVQLGSPRRIRTILRTNVRTAHAAARWQAQQENGKRRPYLLYDAIDDAVTRPSHRALDGLVFRVDDPFWRSHYPPNGWNCRCRVRALTEAGLKRLGLTVSKSSPGDFSPVDATVSGGIEVQTTSWRGIMTPDPGWDYAPTGVPSYSDLRRYGGLFGGGDGAGGTPGIFLPQVRSVLPGQQGPAHFGLPGVWPYGRPLAAERLPRPDGKDAAIAQWYATFGWRGRRRPGDERNAVHTVRTPQGLDDVHIDHRAIEHMAEHQPSRAADAEFLRATLEDPLEVWLVWVRDERGRAALRPHYLAAFEDGRSALAVVQQDSAVLWTLWTFFASRRGVEIDKRRAGHLLYRRGGG